VKTGYKDFAIGRFSERKMTVLVGVISQKGGVGKSTIARLIAREYAAAGWDVKIADLDISQGTSTDWKQRRELHSLQPEIAVEPFRTVPQALKHADVYDLMVLDGAPHSMQGTLEIARACDLLILPTGLSLDDLKPSVLLAHELVKAHIPEDKITFVLCRVGDRENEIEDARSYIYKAGYTTVAGSIPEKTAYRQASDSGRAVSEVTFPTLRQRAEEVAQSIINKLSKQEA
jgi:chromosome partitioning protein